MLRRTFAISTFALCLAPFAAASAPAELPVRADSCSIHYALTGQRAAGCTSGSVGELGDARRLPPAGFDQSAAPLESASEEKGYFIRFPFNSPELTQEYKDHLARLAKVLSSEQLRSSCVKLVGHADSVGSGAYNLRLSTARAKMVAAYLMTLGNVPVERIQTEARGESELISGLPGPHPLNRRVEILARHRTAETCY